MVFEEANEYISREKTKTFKLKDRTTFLIQDEIEGLIDDLTLNSVGYEINKKGTGYFLKTRNCTLDISQEVKNKYLKLNIVFSEFGALNEVYQLNKKNIAVVKNYFQV